jgi:hypothetical protein
LRWSRSVETLSDTWAAEFDAFLECGILAHGFLRLRCGDCGHDKLLAFSCKRRGFCPSCGARRMSQTAAHLVDHVIPHVPVRQWVLSLPIPLRVLLAAQYELVTPALQVVQRVVERHLLGHTGLESDEGQSGAVTLIQRFGSAANLNIHLHCLVLDGVYRCHADGAPGFVEAGAPIKTRPRSQICALADNRQQQVQEAVSQAASAAECEVRCRPGPAWRCRSRAFPASDITWPQWPRHQGCNFATVNPHAPDSPFEIQWSLKSRDPHASDRHRSSDDEGSR